MIRPAAVRAGPFLWRSSRTEKEIGMDYVYHYQSPLGGVTMASDGETLTGLWFDGQKYFAAGLEDVLEEKRLPVFEETLHWLDVYFSGRSPGFLPALNPRGTAFQKAVWGVLASIPYGSTTTYGQIARQLKEKIKRPGILARAVGSAVSRNPVSLLIPCHRVIGADGRLHGYAGGTDKKLWLLKMENVQVKIR